MRRALIVAGVRLTFYFACFGGCLWLGIGCVTPAPIRPPLPEVQWKEHACGLLTSISASKTDVCVGEPVCFTFRIFNPTHKSIQVPAFKDDSAHLTWTLMGNCRLSCTRKEGTCDRLRPGEMQSQTVTGIADRPGQYFVQARLNEERKVNGFAPLVTRLLEINVRPNTGVGVDVSWSETDFIDKVEEVACKNIMMLQPATASAEEEALLAEARRTLLSPDRLDVEFKSTPAAKAICELRKQYRLPNSAQEEELKDIPSSMKVSASLENASFAEGLAAVCNATGLTIYDDLLVLYDKEERGARGHVVGTGNYAAPLRFFRIGRNLRCFLNTYNPIPWLNADSCVFHLEHVLLANGVKHTTQSEDDAKEGAFAFPVLPNELAASKGRITEIKGTLTVLLPTEVKRIVLDPATMRPDQEFVYGDHFLRVGQGEKSSQGPAEPIMGIYCGPVAARGHSSQRGLLADIGSVLPLDTDGADVKEHGLTSFRCLKSMYALDGKMPVKLVWTFCPRVEPIQIPVIWRNVVVPASAYKADEMLKEELSVEPLTTNRCNARITSDASSTAAAVLEVSQPIADAYGSATVGYAPTRQETSFLKKVNEISPDHWAGIQMPSPEGETPDSLAAAADKARREEALRSANQYSLEAANGKYVGWFGIVRKVTFDESKRQTRLLLEHKYFDGLCDANVQVVSICGAGDFIADVHGKLEGLPALNLVRVYGFASKGEDGVARVQAEYIRVWDWGRFTFMNYGQDKTNPKWLKLRKVTDDDLYSPSLTVRFYEERLGRR